MEEWKIDFLSQYIVMNSRVSQWAFMAEDEIEAQSLYSESNTSQCENEGEEQGSDLDSD